VTIEGPVDFEGQLSEMLHRITPEPPRPVTVEDIAIRLANQAAPQRGWGLGRDRDDTAVLRLGKRGRLRAGGVRWAPALAAASVVAIVGASAGIGVALTSHNGKPAAPSGGGVTSTATSTSPVTTSPTTPGTDVTHPPEPRTTVANGIWGAQLIDHQALDPHTLIGSGNSLFGTTSSGFLLRIDPANGDVLAQVNDQATGRPAVARNTVWVALATPAGTVYGYNATTLARVGMVSLPTPGSVAVVAAGPDGDLYVGGGGAIVVVDPSNGTVLRRISVSGNVTSVAVSPDGSKLYVGANANGSFTLVTYNAATGADLGGKGMADGGVGGYLLATSGGIWYTTGTAMSQRVWFAPGGDLSKSQAITAGENGGLDSVPVYANGVVWVGGTQRLECLDPVSGKILAGNAIPADTGIPEHFGSIAFAGGQAFATFQDPHSQLAGVAAVTSPSACAA
jgi:sugar lactone lactonase YvrE